MRLGALARARETEHTHPSEGASSIGTSSTSSRLNRDASLVQELYTFAEEIGAGAFGRVMKAVPKNRPSEVVAIKHIDKRRAGSAGLKSVLSEVETLALLNHSYIVRLEEVFQDKDNLYIVMENVPGGELATALKKIGRLHESIVRKITVCLLLALEYIHDQGIVHRDLKPANCLLTADGSGVKIADFGFAVMVGPTSCLTESCGTPAYLAPEIVISENYGRPVDMWALGVMIYLMLTGDYPFVETSSETLAEAICRGRYSTSSRVWDSDISAGAKDFISKLLVTDPSKRWTAQQCLNHSWIRVARPSGGIGGPAAGLYANEDGEDGGGVQYMSSRALSGMQKFQSAIAGGNNNALVAQGRSTTRPKRGRLRLKIVFRGAVTAVRACMRLIFFTRLHTLRKEGLDGISLLRSYSFVVTRKYVPPVPTLMNCRAIAPGNVRVLTMVVSMFESCPTVECFDLSHNKIDSLELIQHVVRAANAHPNLTILNLDGNPIPPLAGRGLLRLVRFHPNLRVLSVNGTSIGNDTIQQIASTLRDSEKKRHDSHGGGTPSTTSASPVSQQGGGGAQTPVTGSYQQGGNGGSASTPAGSGGTATVPPLPNFSPTPPPIHHRASPNPASSSASASEAAVASSSTSISGRANVTSPGASSLGRHSGVLAAAAAAGGGGGGGSNYGSGVTSPLYHHSHQQHHGSSSHHHAHYMSSTSPTTTAMAPASPGFTASHPQHQNQFDYRRGGGSSGSNNGSGGGMIGRTASLNSSGGMSGSLGLSGSAGLDTSGGGVTGGGGPAGGHISPSSAMIGGRPPVAPGSSRSSRAAAGVGGGGSSSSMSPSSVNVHRTGVHLPPLGSMSSGGGGGGGAYSSYSGSSGLSSMHHHHGSSSETSSYNKSSGGGGPPPSRGGGSSGSSSSHHHSSHTSSYHGKPPGSSSSGGAGAGGATTSGTGAPAPASSTAGKSVPSYMAPLHSSRRPAARAR